MTNKAILLINITVFSLTSTLTFGQSENNTIQKKAEKSYATFLETGVPNKTRLILIDTVNYFQILIKENTIYKYSKSQLNVLNNDSSGISYFVIFGYDDNIYPSLVKHWDISFSKKNPSYDVSNIIRETTGNNIIESADFKITTNGKEMIGKIKTIQNANRIYILQIMTFKNRWSTQQESIKTILDSFIILN